MVPDLEAVAAAMRRHWSLETCDTVDAADWHPGNPARGQCGVSSLVLQEILGGELLLADVFFVDGGRQGYHYWNRLPDGTEVDLTRDQFAPHELVQVPATVSRTFQTPGRLAEQYERLRSAVLADLGLDDSQLTLRFAD